MSSSGASKSLVTKPRENYENSCVVCFIEVTIFSVGSCDHAVCYVCSTRMRVLCGQNECPICRQEQSQVIFTREMLPFRQLEVTTRSGLYDKKYRIVFGDRGIESAFYRLLEESCPRCKCPPFASFDELQKHVRQYHELFYCDLCTKNLRIFTSERRCYTREELAMHRRKGDPDNTSHRGHPLCEFCEIRHQDRDELFRHLRMEHYYCHFCDADGFNQFYADRTSLREHFRDEHYLCEEGSCIEEPMTAVFRTDIDLRAHKTSVHGRTMGKLAAKQARTLEVEFSLVPRYRHGNAAPGQDAEGTTQYRPLMGTTLNQQPRKVINANDEQEFPALGAAGSAPPVPVIRPSSVSIKTKTYGTNALKKTKENFPALGGAASEAVMPPSSSEGSGHYSRMVQKPQPAPPAAPAPATAKQGTIIHISNRPSKHPDAIKDFPALPSSVRGGPKADPPAVVVNPKSVAAKNRKLVEDAAMITPNASIASKLMMVVPPPQPPPKKAPEVKEPKVPKLNSDDNFPTLSASSGSTLPPTWVPLHPVKNKVESRKSKVAPAPDLSQHSAIKTEDRSTKKKSKNPTAKTKDKEAKRESNNNVNGNNNSIADEIGALKISKEQQQQQQPPLPPPPGFNGVPTGGKAKAKAPPGFNSVTLNSVARKPNNDLTFTNSTGETYSIVPMRKYIAPPESKKRNEILLGHFQEALKTSAAIKEFHNISQMFVKNNYLPTPYYEHCLVALGDKFSQVFPELLALLPDIGKQQELYLVHVQHEKGEKTKSKTIIDVCSLCKQVLVRNDLFAHLQAHKLENNFPVLTK